MKPLVLLALLISVPANDPLDDVCKNDVCTLPKYQLRAIQDAYNQNVERIEHLERELHMRDHWCETRRRIES